jgi:hypothetical protein
MLVAPYDRISDCAVQCTVRAAHLFDPVDGVQHRGVVPVTKLPADFLERCPSELPGDIQGKLAGKDLDTPVGVLRVAHHSHTEALTRIA